MKKTILIFGGLSMAIMLLFQLSKYSLLSQQVSMDFYIGGFGILFLGLGIFISNFLSNSTPALIINEEKDIQKEDKINAEELEKTGLSKREYEILLLIAEGQSNLEIATNLFISESTVKSHVSKILMKLNAKRRTQAIQIARELRIL